VECTPFVIFETRDFFSNLCFPFPDRTASGVRIKDEDGEEKEGVVGGVEVGVGIGIGIVVEEEEEGEEDVEVEEEEEEESDRFFGILLFNFSSCRCSLIFCFSSSDRRRFFFFGRASGFAFLVVGVDSEASPLLS